MIASRVLILLSLLTFGQYPSENEWTKQHAEEYNAKFDQRLWDDTRPDLTSGVMVYEVDWADKWAEAIGQSLYYASQTGKRPVIILLVRNRDDYIHVFRCQRALEKVEIELIIRKIKQN